MLPRENTTKLMKIWKNLGTVSRWPSRCWSCIAVRTLHLQH